MGHSDYYVGVLKGAIYRLVPEATVIDITHAITLEQGILPAGYMLRNSYRLFPAGTIHMMAVNTRLDFESRHVIFEHDGHYFVGTDNGVFSLAFDEQPEKIYDISHLEGADGTFPALQVFVPVMAALAKGKKPEEIGRPTLGLIQKTMFRPTIDSDSILGTVIYSDVYGNAITNITRELFEQVGKGRKYVVHIRSLEYGIPRISKSYAEIESGELVAVFNASGNLEIAMSNGSLLQFLKIGVGANIRIAFKNN